MSTSRQYSQHSGYLIDDSHIPIRPSRRSISKSLTLKKRKQFSGIVSNADQIGINSPANVPSSSLIDLKAQLFKFVVIGESGAGKSNLISRFTRNQFEARNKSTIGIDFALHTFRLKQTNKTLKGGQHNGPENEYRAQIWDTAGQERYRSMTRLFYRDVCGALLVFDLTNRSHLQALPRWLDEIYSNQHWSSIEPDVGQSPAIFTAAPSSSSSSAAAAAGAGAAASQYNGRSNIPIILIGNKVDRRDRQITFEESTAFVRQNSLTSYFETSAKTGENVDDAFQALFEASVEHFAFRKPNINRTNSFKLTSNKNTSHRSNNYHANNNNNNINNININNRNLPQQSQTMKHHSSYNHYRTKDKPPKSKCSC